MPKKKAPTDPRFPQDGSPITRELWLEIWPISARFNEWVRAFDATYTLKKVDVIEFPFQPTTTLVVVGPGGVRTEKDFHYDSEDDIKAALWPEGRDTPLTLKELIEDVGF